MLAAVLLLCCALPLTPSGGRGQCLLPLLMLTLCSCQCPQSLVGLYLWSYGSSIMLRATSGSPGTHGIEQGSTCRCQTPGNSSRRHDKWL